MSGMDSRLNFLRVVKINVFELVDNKKGAQSRSASKEWHMEYYDDKFVKYLIFNTKK